MTTDDVLDIQHLAVSYEAADGRLVPILEDVNVRVAAGEIVGIVGESGSGKSTLASAVIGTLAPNAAIADGTIRVLGTDIQELSVGSRRQLRKADLGVITQNPITAMDPTRRVTQAFADIGVKADTARQALRDVGLADADRVLHAFPHELSGGMAQRVGIALANAGTPSIVIADEPTSALDATVADGILSLMVDKARESHSALLMITHDLGIVRRYCDRVVVMRKGNVVEEGATGPTLSTPVEAYTKSLVAATSSLTPRDRPVATTEGEPAIEVENATVVFHAGPPWARVDKTALKDVSLTIRAGEMLGLVGHSGSGKSTLCNLLLGLQSPTSGRVLVDGRPLRSTRRRRGAVQVVLQHPDWALNPALKVGRSIAEPLFVVERLGKDESRARVLEVMQRLELDPSLADRYPHELSGGQRQRASIARALIASPKLLVFDEAVSSLDVSVQAQVLREIVRLQTELNFTGVFVSHDPRAVAFVADRVVQLADGVVVDDVEGSRHE